LEAITKNVPIVVKDTLAKNELELDDVNLFVFHQANKYMLNFLRKKMKIAEDKFYVNMANVGNTVSNSIAIALCDAQQENKLSGNILLCGFGVGYSWGGCVIKKMSNVLWI
jgi:3-oxoacyl-[acyl-carrier-protein] synthase-3